MLGGLTSVGADFGGLLPVVLINLTIGGVAPSNHNNKRPIETCVLTGRSGCPIRRAFTAIITSETLSAFPFIMLTIVAVVNVAFCFSFSL